MKCLSANLLATSDFPQASFGGVELHVSPLSADFMFWDFAKTASNHSLRMDWVTGFIPYGARWRSLRRGLHAHLHPAASKAYRPLEQRAVHHLLRNLLQSPEMFAQHLRQ
jgi:cytochrome P450